MTSNIQDIRNSAKKIAWGFFLMHMNFNLGPVDILPDWAGYALIVSALAFVVAFEEDLKKLRTVGIALLMWSVITWIGDIFGIGTYLSYVGFIPAIGNMYFIYRLFSELSDVSDKYSCPQTSSLRFWGIANVVLTGILTVVLYVSYIFTNEELLIVVSSSTLALGFIVMLGSMITLFRFSSALKDVSDNNIPEVHIVENVNPFGDGAEV